MLHIATAASGLEIGVEGTVRVTAPPGMVELLLAPSMIELRKKHPALIVELDASQQVLDLSRREADIALRVVRPRGADLVMTKLATTRYVPMASRPYAKAIGRLGAGPRASPCPAFIAWSDAYAHIPPATWLTKHVDPKAVVLKTSSLGAQLAAAASGLGVALLPVGIPATYGLTHVPFHRNMAAAEADLPSEDVWLVGHRALRDVPRVAAVWAFLLELAKRVATIRPG